MNDIYQINVAKSEFRDAYATADVEKLLSVFADPGFTDMSEGGPSKFGPEARSRLRDQASALFADYDVRLTPIIIDIIVLGNAAYDYGWHEFTLTPKTSGEVIRKRQRYFELWTKASGEWKIALQINNADVKEELHGQLSHWFLSEDQTAAVSN